MPESRYVLKTLTNRTVFIMINQRDLKMQTYKIIIIISILLTLLIIALYINFFVIPQKNESKMTVKTITKPESLLKETKERLNEPEEANVQLNLPPLNDSDNFIREYLKKKLNSPSFTSWLNQNDLIRRFVAVVDNIANGENPSENLKFLAPKKPFQTLKEYDQVIADPQNYSRFDAMVNIFHNLETVTLISLYGDLRPLINQAYAEMGYPDKQFNDVLRQAMAILLKTPSIKTQLYLEKKVITYNFKDPDLEALSPAQKLLLRTGPENMRKIKEKLKQLKAKLNFPADND